MKNFHLTPPVRKALLGFLVIALLTLWILFAPTQLGGSTTYVILTGNSMSPRFQINDLVLVRQAKAYHIGDIVAYHHPDIGLVFHRIIARDDDGRFIMQGDHNDWTDSYQPAPDEIAGRFWLHLPGAGGWLRTLRKPFWLAFISLIISFLFIMSFQQADSQEKTSRPRESRLDVLFFWGALFLTGLILGLFAFRTPVTVTNVQQIPYQQKVQFAYSAHVPENLYDQTIIQPGEPIFRKINDSFDVQVHYNLQTPAAAEIQGTYRLLVRISDDTGWKRTLILAPETPFSGTSIDINGAVDLNALQAFIDALEEQTDFSASRYFLSIIPQITIHGSLDNHPLEASFAPELRFQFDDLEVHLYNDPFTNANLLSPSASASITYEESLPNTLPILGIDLPVKTARGLALLFGLGGLIGLTLNGITLYRASQRSEIERIHLLYGPQIVHARDIQFDQRLHPVEMATIEDLTAIAEQGQRPIIHLPDGSLHHYFVQDNAHLYHFQTSDFRPQEAELISGNAPSLLPAWLNPGSYRQMQTALQETLKNMAETLDRRIYETDHARNVAELSRALAETLGLPERSIHSIYLGAYLHDIGLTDIPEDLLTRPARLSPEEQALIRQHTQRLPESLKNLPAMRPIREIIIHHHEHWDGSGYPDGLTGEEIPLGARIVAVAEVWDALSHDRPHRAAWEESAILDYFQEQSGQHFDPTIVEALIKLKGRAAARAEAVPASAEDPLPDEEASSYDTSQD